MAKGMVMALGFFDGVHLGHLQLINKVIEIAKQTESLSSVMTFENHPFTMFFPESVPLLLTNNEEKKRLILDAGIDQVIIEPFTEALMRFSPEAFIDDFLLKKFPIRHIVVGYDYSFGHKGKGTVKTLQKLSRNRGFGVSVIPPYLFNNRKVCSTMIRDNILKGNVEHIDQLLGRQYTISGKVIHGKQLGREYGIPTANMTVDPQKVIPNSGVYYSKVQYDGCIYDGLTNVGNNPTFKDHPFSIETSIYDFDKTIYDATISVTFLRKIRDEIKFQSVELLIKQIRNDIQMIDEIRKKDSEQPHEI